MRRSLIKNRCYHPNRTTQQRPQYLQCCDPIRPRRNPDAKPRRVLRDNAFHPRGQARTLKSGDESSPPHESPRGHAQAVTRLSRWVRCTKATARRPPTPGKPYSPREGGGKMASPSPKRPSGTRTGGGVDEWNSPRKKPDGASSNAAGDNSTRPRNTTSGRSKDGCGVRGLPPPARSRGTCPPYNTGDKITHSLGCCFKTGFFDNEQSDMNAERRVYEKLSARSSRTGYFRSSLCAPLKPPPGFGENRLGKSSQGVLCVILRVVR